jgi:hypothetical protein
LQIETAIKTDNDNHQYVKKLLGTSSSMAFKVWQQIPYLKYTAWSSGILLTALIVWFFIAKSETLLPTLEITVGKLGKFILGIFIALLATYLLGVFAKVIYWRSALTRIAIGIGMCIFGWLAARIHLLIFDKIFLKRGSLNSLKALE